MFMSQYWVHNVYRIDQHFITKLSYFPCVIASSGCCVVACKQMIKNVSVPSYLRQENTKESNYILTLFISLHWLKCWLVQFWTATGFKFKFKQKGAGSLGHQVIMQNSFYFYLFFFTWSSLDWCQKDILGNCIIYFFFYDLIIWFASVYVYSRLIKCINCMVHCA